MTSKKSSGYEKIIVNKDRNIILPPQIPKLPPTNGGSFFCTKFPKTGGKGKLIVKYEDKSREVYGEASILRVAKHQTDRTNSTNTNANYTNDKKDLWVNFNLQLLQLTGVTEFEFRT